jgi:polyketide cyclase/dehydrase/lipid transport protein
LTKKTPVDDPEDQSIPRRCIDDWGQDASAQLTPSADEHRLRREAVTTGCVDITRPAVEVWTAIREPLSVVRWNPIVEFARMEGTHRILELATGEALIERIDLRDDRRRVLAYSLVLGPIPGATHRGTIAVNRMSPNATQVIYTTQVSPAGTPDRVAGTVQLAMDYLGASLSR